MSEICEKMTFIVISFIINISLALVLFLFFNVAGAGLDISKENMNFLYMFAVLIFVVKPIVNGQKLKIKKEWNKIVYKYN